MAEPARKLTATIAATPAPPVRGPLYADFLPARPIPERRLVQIPAALRQAARLAYLGAVIAMFVAVVW